MTIKKWWEYKPYWLRGGLIGGIFFILLCAIVIIFSIKLPGSLPGAVFMMHGALSWQLVSLPMRHFFGIPRLSTLTLLLSFGFVLAQYFIAGAVTGWVISKIKIKKVMD